MQRFGKISLLGLCLVANLALAGTAGAAVYISELMYDPEGSDSEREWLEVYNTYTHSIDLTEYSFFEQGVAHRISLARGEGQLGEGERAVIADQPAAFLLDYPNYTGALYDSSFSLKNTGEELALHNELDEVEFRLVYDSESGGAGNGATLGLIGDIWYETVASPGEENTRWAKPASQEENKKEEGREEDTANPESQQQSTNTNKQTKASSNNTVPADKSPATYLELKHPEYEARVIQADAGSDRILMAGVAYYFTGAVYGLQGGPVETFEVKWNWGDGQTGTGKTDRHTYRYSGEYTLTMYASMGRYFDRDRVQITVIPPALHVVLHPEEPGVVGVYNDSDYHLELSGYLLEQTGRKGEYVFPEGTFVNTGNTLYLAPEVFSYHDGATSSVVLSDGSGHSIDELGIAQALLEQQIAETQAQQGAHEPQVSNSAEENKATSPAVARAAGATHSVVYRSVHATKAQAAQATDPEAAPDFDKQPALASGAGQTALVYQGDTQGAVSYQTWLMLLLLVVGGAAYAFLYFKNKPHNPTSSIDIIEK